MLSVVLSIGLQLTDDTEISIRAKAHELTNDMMKRAKGEGIVRYINLNQMIFYVQYEHMMVILD